MRGQVHDENAFALGGASGHAGLFGTADALLDFAAACSHGTVLLACRAMAELRTRQTPTRTLGWEMAYPGWSGGDACSARHARPYRLHRHGAVDRLRLAAAPGPCSPTACIRRGTGTAASWTYAAAWARSSLRGERSAPGGREASRKLRRLCRSALARVFRPSQDVLQHPVDRCEIGRLDALGQARLVGARHRDNRLIDFAALRR